MEDIARLGGEPADGRDIVAAPHEAHIGRLVRLPGIARQALHGPFQAAREGHDREEDVVLGDQEIMDHGRIRGLEVGAAHDLAGGVRHAIAHGGGEGTVADAIAEPDHLAGLRIQLGVGSDPSGVLGRVAPGLQGVAVKLEGHVPLFQGQKPASVEEDVGVGDAAVLPRGHGVAQHGVEAAEQGPSVLALEFPLRGPDIAVAVGHLAPVNPEGMDHAVAGEPVVMRIQGLELGIGTRAIKRALEARRDLPHHLEVKVIFGPERSEVSVQVGIAAGLLAHRGLASAGLRCKVVNLPASGRKSGDAGSWRRHAAHFVRRRRR